MHFDDVRWSEEIWFPRMIAAGLRYIAFVVPRKVVAQMSVKLVMSGIDESEVRSAYFDDIKDARAWLCAQK